MYNILTLLSARVPNFLEIVIGTLPQSLLEVWFDEYTEKFNNDPISKGIFRDVTGIPATITHAIINTEVGKTDIKNDWISSGGNLIQAACKLSFLAPVLNNETSTSDDVSKASELSYYLCSPISSTLNVISRERQSEGMINQSPLQYIYYNIKPTWFVQSILGSLVTTSFASSAAKFLKNIDYSLCIKNSLFYVENKLLIDFFDYPDVIDIDDAVWTKLDKLNNAIDTDNFYVGNGILLGSSFISKLAVNVMNSYVIATSARIGLLCFDTVLKEHPLMILSTVAMIADQKISDYISSAYFSETNYEDAEHVFLEADNKGDETADEVMSLEPRSNDCCWNNLSVQENQDSMFSYIGYRDYQSFYTNHIILDMSSSSFCCDVDN